MIAVTSGAGENWLSWPLIRGYIWWRGLKSMKVTPENYSTLKDFSGLLLLGGRDINPKHYGQVPLEKQEFNDARDEMELELVRLALKKDIPILGICRGMQLLNVALGGELHQDVSSLFEDFLPTRSTLAKIFTRRYVVLEPASKLFDTLGRSSFYKVNSLHRQGIKKLGDHVEVSAKEKNGLIQGIEWNQNRFVIGVQWHPEYILFKKSSRNLFKAFLDATEER